MSSANAILSRLSTIEKRAGWSVKQLVAILAEIEPLKEALVESQRELHELRETNKERVASQSSTRASSCARDTNDMARQLAEMQALVCRMSRYQAQLEARLEEESEMAQRFRTVNNELELTLDVIEERCEALVASGEAREAEIKALRREASFRRASQPSIGRVQAIRKAKSKPSTEFRRLHTPVSGTFSKLKVKSTG